MFYLKVVVEDRAIQFPSSVIKYDQSEIHNPVKALTENPPWSVG